MKKYLKTDEWNIIEDSFQADRMRWSESIFSLGNGRFGQRGYFEEPYSSDSYRGAFVAGITNSLPNHQPTERLAARSKYSASIPEANTGYTSTHYLQTAKPTLQKATTRWK